MFSFARLWLSKPGPKAKNLFHFKIHLSFLCGTLSRCLSAQRNVSFLTLDTFFNQIKIINFCFTLTQGVKARRQRRCQRRQMRAIASVKRNSGDGRGQKAHKSPVDSLSSSLIIHLRPQHSSQLGFVFFCCSLNQLLAFHTYQNSLTLLVKLFFSFSFFLLNVFFFCSFTSVAQETISA